MFARGLLLPLLLGGQLTADATNLYSMFSIKSTALQICTLQMLHVEASIVLLAGAIVLLVDYTLILRITVYGGSSAEWRVSGSDILRWRRRAGGGSVIKLSRFCPQHRLCLSITALCRSLCNVGKVQFVLAKLRRTRKIVLDRRVATNFTFITYRWNLGGEKQKH